MFPERQRTEQWHMLTGKTIILDERSSWTQTIHIGREFTRFIQPFQYLWILCGSHTTRTVNSLTNHTPGICEFHVTQLLPIFPSKLVQMREGVATNQRFF